MVPVPFVRTAALAFPGAAASPHFEKESFRIRNRIFATLDVAQRRLVVKLSPVDQSVYSDAARSAIFPVSGGWGAQGWTVVDLRRANKRIVTDVLATAYRTVAEKYSARKK